MKSKQNIVIMAAKDDTRMSLASLREKLKILQIQSTNNQNGKVFETPSSTNILQPSTINHEAAPTPVQQFRRSAEGKVFT